MNVHLHHLRGAVGTRSHFDWSANEDSLRELEPAEHIQTDPLTVLRSIDRADFFYSICIFSALAFVAGAVLAMGAK